VILRRFPSIHIIIVPVKVQGDEAAAEMVEALDVINREISVDVIVLTRGGGSLEDLWAFNQEDLARAIRASRIPVVSAVGHEVDYTISDMVADFRAPTPSAAAELLVVEMESLKARLGEVRERILLSIHTALAHSKQRLALLSKGLRDPRKRLTDSWQRLDELNERLLRSMDSLVKEHKRSLASEGRALLLHSPARMLASLTQRIDFHRHTLILMISRRIREHRMALAHLEKRLKDLNPSSVLKRGYSIVRKLPEKLIIKDVSGLSRGDRVLVTLAEGEIECRIEEITES
jgi:exodeoxyribonuclease VII large subunit